ncbi:hypothetical protein GCM10027280_31260 [Micromonospora polyrhachis]|uniref:DUF308 domain-containing protein n=1 Tax=Micromonospora polyrhachis TaxID=1282883 RepID=A0A7W7SUE7_9ACTN|nr:DUF308 domain-containing protein [Micromonospora polyrhachis]MBB4961153.1 hypothetical protein [Micromonospora polyrhachis]
MSAGGARRGRRDNGLDATEYAVAGDVDPRVGEHLLDVLAAGGIAAYLQPSADLNPVTRTTTVPSRPTDRLYVDRVHLATARDYLTQLADEDLPKGNNEPDIEAEWAKIVAGYHTEVTPDTRPWPAVEDVPATKEVVPDKEVAVDHAGDETGDPPAGGTATAVRPGPATTGVRPLTSATDISGISVGGRADEPSLLDGLDTFGRDLPDDPNEGYTPPPPPPLPQVSKFAVAAVLGIIVGFVLLLFPTLLPIDRSLTTTVGFVGILTGFVTLIWRLRPGDEEEDDPDDGAVV